MNKIFIAVVVFTFFLSALGTDDGNEDFPVLKGQYLGQKLPGKNPEVFAPKLLATDGTPFNSAFSPDGNEFFYSVSSEKKKRDQIWFTRRVNNIWTNPEIAPFSGKYDDCDVSFSPDGQRLFFISLGRILPGKSDPTKRNFIWFVERTRTGWTKARLLDYPGNRGGVYPTSAANRTLYFSSRLEKNFGKGDIYRSRFINGAYRNPENLGAMINSKYGESDAYIAPDESFLVVTCWERPENIGGGESDLYISYLKQDGTWIRLVNLGNSINTQYIEFCPSFSPDRKYFFFSRYIKETNDCNIFWVDARILEELKPKGLK